LPLSGAIFTFSRLVPRLLPRFGPKRLMVTGAALITLGMLWLTQISAGTTYFPGLLGPMLLFGIGGGLSFTPLSVMILSGVQRQDAGAASGLLQAMQQVGAALGVSILVTRFGIVSRETAKHPLTNVTPQAQAHHIMAEAMSSAFTLSAIFAICVLLVALFAIKISGTGAQQQPAFVPAGD
jgi:MFS family permease